MLHRSYVGVFALPCLDQFISVQCMQNSGEVHKSPNVCAIKLQFTRGVRAWWPSMAKLLPARLNPATQLAMSHSASKYPSCIVDHWFSKYELLRSRSSLLDIHADCHTASQWVTYQCCHIVTNAASWYMFGHMQVHLYSTSHHHCLSSVFS